MIVWKIESDNANPLGEANIGFFETKSDAENHAKANGIRGVKPERVKVENRIQLAHELNFTASMSAVTYASKTLDDLSATIESNGEGE
tara:strand:+ start:443 stop:706 length:264 start_codon:yes stop_codon:yes gene_type:complete